MKRVTFAISEQEEARKSNTLIDSLREDMLDFMINEDDSTAELIDDMDQLEKQLAELGEGEELKEQLLADALEKAKRFWGELIKDLHRSLEEMAVQANDSDAAMGKDTTRDEEARSLVDTSDGLSPRRVFTFRQLWLFMKRKIRTYFRDSLYEMESVSKGMRDTVNIPCLTRIKRKGRLVIREDSLPNLQHGAQTTVPYQIFDNIGALLKKHVFDRTTFDAIKIDNQFLECFGRTMTGTANNYYIFDDVLFDVNLDLNKFIEFLKSADLQALEIDLKFQDPSINFGEFIRLFDESFLTNFTISKINIRPSFIFRGSVLMMDMMANRANQLKPSADFFPILTQFKRFDLQTMIFEPETLLEIAMKRMETDETEAEWRFTLTRQMTEDDFENIDFTKYELFSDIEDRTRITLSYFTVNKISNQFKCTFEVGEDSSIMVFVQFYEHG